MRIFNKDIYIYIGGLFLGLFFFSLLFYFLKGDKLVMRTLFFPQIVALEEGHEQQEDFKFKSESRLLPLLGSQEDNIRLLIEELLLGPIRVEIENLLPGNVRIISFYIDKETVRLNLSADLILYGFDPSLYTQKTLTDFFKKNICFNFRSIKKVQIFIDGQSFAYTQLKKPA